MPDGAIAVSYFMAISQQMSCSGQHCSLLQSNREMWEETARFPKVSVFIVNGERMVPEQDKSDQQICAVIDSSRHL